MGFALICRTVAGDPKSQRITVFCFIVVRNGQIAVFPIIPDSPLIVSVPLLVKQIRLIEVHADAFQTLLLLCC